MEKKDEELIRSLLDQDPELNRYYDEHLALEAQLDDFNRKLYLTPAIFMGTRSNGESTHPATEHEWHEWTNYTNVRTRHLTAIIHTEICYCPIRDIRFLIRVIRDKAFPVCRY